MGKKAAEQIYSRKNLIKVAKLSYQAGLSQHEIADKLGFSRSQVYRMLARAKNLGIVTINICEHTFLPADLGKRIQELWGIEAIVVPSGKDIEESKERVGKAAAEYLSSKVTNGIKIGIEWGSTIQKMVKEFHTIQNAKKIELFQLAGGIHNNEYLMAGHQLIMHFADKIKAHYHLLQYPFIVGSKELARLIMKDNQKYFDKLNDLDIAVIGVGSDKPENMALYKGGYISLSEAKKLVRDGFAADICGHRLTSDGKPVETFLSQRVITISAKAIKQIPATLAITAGPDRGTSLSAALAGGFINTVIIDEMAAIALLGKDISSHKPE